MLEHLSTVLSLSMGLSFRHHDDKIVLVSLAHVGVFISTMSLQRPVLVELPVELKSFVVKIRTLHIYSLVGT